MRLLVTGGSGFIGNALLASAVRDPALHVRGAVRRGGAGLPAGVEPVFVGDLVPETDWTHAVSGVDAVVHTAARVHVMREVTADPLAEFRHINVEGTLKMARQAAEAGVRRFVFLSSVKVNGEQTWPGLPYHADDVPAPIDPYGISKHEGELGLRGLAQESGMDVVIIRPVLVYGPGVKGNYLSLIRSLYKGIPLPLGAIHNQRSLVALDNLVDLIVTCLHHPSARNETFLVSDGDDLSTTALLRRIAAALGRPARLVPIPGAVLAAAGRLLGKGDVVQRLCGSLQVDIAKTREMLGWAPPVAVDEALAKTARDFLASRHAR